MHVGTPGRSACPACGVGAPAWAAGRTCRGHAKSVLLDLEAARGEKNLTEVNSARSWTPELKLTCPDSWLQAASSKLPRWLRFCHHGRGECKNHLKKNCPILARIDGCRELAGNWFSPRGAVGTQRDQSPISPGVSANIASGAHASPKQFGTTSEEISRTLQFSPTRSLRAPLLLRPRWRRGHEERSNRHIEHKKRELSCKKVRSPAPRTRAQ
jgi:hypothetical protein